MTGPLILAVSNITPTVDPLTHRWQRRKKTNCVLHFRVINLKNFPMNPAVMGSQEQTTVVKQLSIISLAARSVLLISKGQYTSCKRRSLIIEDEFKNTYFY